LELEVTHTIDIDKFVPAEDNDRRYYEKPYYMAPNGKTCIEAFWVIRDAIKDKDKVALARIVMAGHVIALGSFRQRIAGDDAERCYLAIFRSRASTRRWWIDSKSGRFDPTKSKESMTRLKEPREEECRRPHH
jgi:hypothetical protein